MYHTGHSMYVRRYLTRTVKIQAKNKLQIVRITSALITLFSFFFIFHLPHLVVYGVDS